MTSRTANTTYRNGAIWKFVKYFPQMQISLSSHSSVLLSMFVGNKSYTCEANLNWYGISTIIVKIIIPTGIAITATLLFNIADKSIIKLPYTIDITIRLTSKTKTEPPTLIFNDDNGKASCSAAWNPSVPYTKRLEKSVAANNMIAEAMISAY